MWNNDFVLQKLIKSKIFRDITKCYNIFTIILFLVVVGPGLIIYYFMLPIINLHFSSCEKYCDNNKMSQHFYNTFIFSCGGSQSNNLLFYFILTYKKLTPQQLWKYCNNNKMSYFHNTFILTCGRSWYNIYFILFWFIKQLIPQQL